MRQIRNALALSIPLVALASGISNEPLSETRTAAANSPENRADRPVPARVSAFARLRPKGGVRALTGPAGDTMYRVDKVLVEAGEMVAAGQPLLELDVRKTRAATLALAEAAVMEAQISIDFAQIDIKRKTRLNQSASASVSQSQLDTARKTLEMAQAQLNTAQRQVDYDRMQFEQAVIRAPVDGMILGVSKQAGEGVIAGEYLIEMGEVAQMEALAEVFETNARFIRVGQKAEFTSAALPRPVTGTVQQILPKVAQTTIYSTDALANLEKRVVNVVIALDQSTDVLLMNGFQGTVLIDTAKTAGPVQ